MDAVYPSSASALARGRRRRHAELGPRRRTAPVTFAEIKEVDEDNVEACAEMCEVGRRRPDVLDERLGRQFAECRRRRARAGALREREPDSPPAPPLPPPAPPSPPPAPRAPPAQRAGSEPAALHHCDSADSSDT